MRTTFPIIAAALAISTASGCSANDDDGKGPGMARAGTGSSRTFAIADFTGVELGAADDVDVRLGTAFSVRAEGPSAELDKLRIVKHGDTLEVGRKPGADWGHHDPVTIHVTLPRIAQASVAGSGMMTVDRVTGGDFVASIGGSGNLSIAAISVDRAEMSIAGSGGMMAVGTAKALEINIAGSGDLTAPQLVAQQAEVSIAGSGDARATVNGPAEVNILGSGDVDLGPGATCKVSKMGSGEVSCR